MYLHLSEPSRCQLVKALFTCTYKSKIASIHCWLFCFCLAESIQGQALSDSVLREKFSAFRLNGYGAMHYYHFDWQTDSSRRDAIDQERFILDMGYRWTPRIGFNAEVEFEHGGTGGAVEFDRFEEFGEFEFDISKGGEVIVEQMNLELGLYKDIKLKVGRVKVPFGMMFKRDEPTDYLTCWNSEMETQILPENWTDNGFLVSGSSGKTHKLNYYLGFVNGLDGSAFNSANWIKRGNQRRFETVNAENFALSARLDYSGENKWLIGFSIYGCNTTDNRPKPDLRLSTPLFLSEGHFQMKMDPVRVAAMLLYGTLDNSEALTNQNRNLSNNLNVKRTPVGSEALGAFAELELVIFGTTGFLKNKNESELLFYSRYDYYDTMHKTQGLVFNNPRWERQSFSTGLVYKIIRKVHLKTQFTLRKVGAPAPTSIRGGRLEKTFAAGFAFEF
ncbi:MAG: hypothetical protein KA251_03580 [Saprospiraceae bacterium]|nr:hypothetical protein [Candidatus Vicinibacter affinis]MBK7798484.1 hypothetical protein [Candidatus Vicinibacter affinis]MBP6172933.1 hypothetical protein [Saprospiraceae bacterium]MBP6522041.1 hypothetical protein [Saprospiraceae bacterium]